MNEVETLQLVIAVLTFMLAISELFFPFLSPYQGFVDAIVQSLTKKVEEEKKVTINENKNIVVPSSFTTTEEDKSE